MSAFCLLAKARNLWPDFRRNSKTTSLLFPINSMWLFNCIEGSCAFWRTKKQSKYKNYRTASHRSHSLSRLILTDNWQWRRYLKWSIDACNLAHFENAPNSPFSNDLSLKKKIPWRTVFLEWATTGYCDFTIIIKVVQAACKQKLFCMYFFRRFVYYVNKMVVFQLIPSRIVEFVISIFFCLSVIVHSCKQWPARH